jgi:hypothetical protein
MNKNPRIGYNTNMERNNMSTHFNSIKAIGSSKA